MELEPPISDKPPKAPTNLTRRSLRWGVSLVVVALVVGFAGETLRQAWGKLSLAEVRVSLGWAVASAGIYLVALLPMAGYWALVLRNLGQRPRMLDVLRGYYLGHLGKYVPGKAMVVVLRTGSLQASGCDARATVVAVFLETLTFMATGAAMAGLLLVTAANAGPAYTLLAIGIAIVLGLPVAPPVAKRLARIVLGKKNFRESSAEITWTFSIVGVILAMASWAMLGLSLWAALRAVGASSALPLTQLGLWIESAALPMVAGFVSLLPGGLGVRDLLVTELLTPQISPETALLAAALWRVVSLVAELFACGTMEVARKFRLGLR